MRFSIEALIRQRMLGPVCCGATRVEAMAALGRPELSLHRPPEESPIWCYGNFQVHFDGDHVESFFAEFTSVPRPGLATRSTAGSSTPARTGPWTTSSLCCETVTLLSRWCKSCPDGRSCGSGADPTFSSLHRTICGCGVQSPRRELIASLRNGNRDHRRSALNTRVHVRGQRSSVGTPEQADRDHRAPHRPGLQGCAHAATYPPDGDHLT